MRVADVKYGLTAAAKRLATRTRPRSGAKHRVVGTRCRSGRKGVSREAIAGTCGCMRFWTSSALRYRTDHVFMAAGGQHGDQSEQRSGGPAAAGNPKSIVLYDKECINKMRVVRGARRDSHGERAGRHAAKMGALRSVRHAERRPDTAQAEQSSSEPHPSKPTRDQ